MEMITHKQIPNATKLTIEEIILVIIELELEADKFASEYKVIQ